MPQAPWYVDAFTSAYLDVYAHRDESSARREARGVLNLLRWRPERGRLLDLAAGTGRHALAFRALGVPVTCLDLSRDLTQRCRASGLTTVCADMRALPLLDGSFGGLACLFSSFGYFEDEADHARVLREIARVLIPGGAALLDLMDRDTVRWSLQPQSVEIIDGRTIEIERAMVDGGRRVAKTIRILRAGSDTLAWQESVRLFDGDELDALSARAGLRLEATFGDFDGRPHRSGETRRLVVLRKAVAA
jgi:SAM-dependent methyltransferase